jgi:hypothetical protein
VIAECNFDGVNVVRDTMSVCNGFTTGDGFGINGNIPGASPPRRIQGEERFFFTSGRDSGDTLSSNTGPHDDGDHTSPSNRAEGKYAYIECSNAPQNRYARLFSPELSGTGTNGRICVSFWYSMYGSTVQDLRAFILDPRTRAEVEIMTMSGNQGRGWFEFSQTVTINVQSDDYYVGIESSGCTAYDGDVAVDDVRITTGPCANERP